MKILYALDSYRPNIDGVAVSIERQALRLSARGHEAAIIAPGQRFEDYEERNSDILVFRVHSVKLILDRWRLVVLPQSTVDRLVESFKPDLVVVTLPFPLNSAVLEAARKHFVPVVGITGTMPEWLFYNVAFLKPFSKALSAEVWRRIVNYYNKCDMVVAVTATARDLLLDHGLRLPTKVISNGVQLDDFRPRPRDRALADLLGIPDKPCVLYTGRLDSEKCMDIWIKAIPEVLKHVGAHFIIGGDGSEKGRLMDAVSKMGLSDHVTFTGFLDFADYRQLYSLATVFAISSPAELQSIVTLEAASSGLPVVAVNAGALPELVHEGKNGYLFVEGDSRQMAEALTAILSNPDVASRMGRASRRVAEAHDLDYCVSEYENLYRRLLARPVDQPFQAAES